MDAKPEPRPCRPCDFVWGTLGLVAGIVLLFMGADLISGGALTRTLSKGPGIAPVIPIRSASDNAS
jgi:hypothetical protein